MYEYNAMVLKITDGDTLDLAVDLGMSVSIRIKRCRLYGLDAPEMNTAAGKAARAFIAARIDVGSRVRVKTYKMPKTTDEKMEKFGGYLVEVFPNPGDSNAVSLNDELLKEGHAKPYFGGTR